MKRAGANEADASKRRGTCSRNLRALNSQFCSWVQQQLATRPQEEWEAEARQYVMYLAQIQRDFSDVLDAACEASAPSEVPAAPVAAAPAPSTAASPSAWPGLSAGAFQLPASLQPLPATQPLVGGFTPGLFNFGTAAPSFGTAPGASPFAFGTAAPPPPQQPAEEAEDEEPERPPSPSLVKSSAEDDGEAVVYEAKCKVLFKTKEGGWSERGVGNLQLRRSTQGPRAARLLVRNDTGKLTLNASLYPTLKVSVKSKGLLMNLLNGVQPEGQAAAEGANQPVLTMLRVKSEAEADKLKALIEAQRG